jgi:hypothetical protein
MSRLAVIRDRRRIWIGIAGVILSVVVVWGAAACRRSALNSDAASERGDVGAAADPVRDYLQFTAALEESQAPTSTGDLSFVVEGLRRLAGALGTLSLGSPTLQVDLRVAAEHLVLNPESPATSAAVRDGFLRAADAVESGDAGRMALHDVGGSIDPRRPLLEQQATVRTFFREVAIAIRARR